MTSAISAKPMNPRLKYFLIAALIVLIDQVVKVAVKLNMEPNEEINLIGNLFKLHFIENKGAAFGIGVSHLVGLFGTDLPEDTGKLILSLFSIAAVSVIGYMLYKVSSLPTKLPFFVAMILGGAVGNIIDRVFYGMIFKSINASYMEPFNYEGGLFHGRVVDMFFFDAWSGFLPDYIPFFGNAYLSLWPIFNVADAAISIGIICILLFQKRFFALIEKKETAPQTATPSEEKAAEV